MSESSHNHEECNLSISILSSIGLVQIDDFRHDYNVYLFANINNIT